MDVGDGTEVAPAFGQNAQTKQLALVIRTFFEGRKLAAANKDENLRASVPLRRGLCTPATVARRIPLWRRVAGDTRRYLVTIGIAQGDRG